MVKKLNAKDWELMGLICMTITFFNSVVILIQMWHPINPWGYSVAGVLWTILCAYMVRRIDKTRN